MAVVSSYEDIWTSGERRHLARAEYWRERGMPDYALGSERKAARWAEKRTRFREALAWPNSDSLDGVARRVEIAKRRMMAAIAEGLYGPS